MNFVMDFDINLLILISALRNGTLDGMMWFFSTIGNYGAFWILLGIILTAFKKTRKCGILVLVSLAIGYIFGNLIIKPIVNRARPMDIFPQYGTGLIDRPMGQSFPSGHTTASFAAATAIFLKNKRYGIVAYAVAVVIAISRLYLFVHYPTDILGGIIVGVVASFGAKFVVLKLTEKLSKQKNQKV